jgi:hypothetical protein
MSDAMIAAARRVVQQRVRKFGKAIQTPEM